MSNISREDKKHTVTPAQEPQGSETQQESTVSDSYARRDPGIQRPQRDVRSITDINSAIGRRRSFGRTDSHLNRIVKTITDTRDSDEYARNTEPGLEVIVIDKEQVRLPVSAILFFRAFTIGTEKVIFIHPVLIDGGERITPRRENINGESLEIDVRVTDHANNVYFNRLADFMNKSHDAEARIVPAGIWAVGKNFNFEDPDNVLDVLEHANGRLYDALGEFTNEEKFSLANFRAVFPKISAQLDFNDAPARALNGEPIRSDLAVTLKASRNDASREEEAAGYPSEQSVTIGKVNGYVTLFPIRAPLNEQVWGLQNQNQQQNQRFFAAQLVLTSSNRGRPDEANTPEVFLTNLLNAFYATADGAWLHTLLPRLTEGRDKKDLSALGLWITGDRFESVNTTSFTDGDLRSFAQTFFESDASGTPSLAISLDINPVGENSGVEAFAVDAATNKNNGNGHRRFIEAANALTNGSFSEFYQNPDEPIFIPTNSLVSLGPYTDGQGVERDRRDFDFLAILALSDGDLTTVRKWVDTFSNSLPPAHQLAIREKIESRFISSTSAKPTGRASRLFVNPRFIWALYSAAVKSGVSPVIENSAFLNAQGSFSPNQALLANLTNYHASNGYVGNTGGYAGGVQSTFGGNNFFR